MILYTVSGQVKENITLGNFMFACSAYGTKECLFNMVMKISIFDTSGELIS
jgi:hypothetical protein